MAKFIMIRDCMACPLCMIVDPGKDAVLFCESAATDLKGESCRIGRFDQSPLPIPDWCPLTEATEENWKDAARRNTGGDRMKKTWIHLRLGRFWFEAGWFGGEEPVVFRLELGLIISECAVSVLALRVVKLGISFGFDLE